MTGATCVRYLRKKKTVVFSTKMAELEGMADNWMLIGDDVEEVAVEGGGDEAEGGSNESAIAGVTSPLFI